MVSRRCSEEQRGTRSSHTLAFRYVLQGIQPSAFGQDGFHRPKMEVEPTGNSGLTNQKWRFKQRKLRLSRKNMEVELLEILKHGDFPVSSISSMVCWKLPLVRYSSMMFPFQCWFLPGLLLDNLLTILEAQLRGLYRKCMKMIEQTLSLHGYKTFGKTNLSG